MTARAASVEPSWSLIVTHKKSWSYSWLCSLVLVLTPLADVVTIVVIVIVGGGGFVVVNNRAEDRAGVN